MKILIAVPTYENIEPATFKSIYDLDPCGHEIDFESVTGYAVDIARNRIVDMALERGYDYVLMVDSDMVLPHDAIYNLTNPLTDICSGVCPRRGTTTGRSELYKLGCRYLNEESNINYALVDRLVDIQNYRIEIGVAGGACMLINTDVFRNIEYPWFKFELFPNRGYTSEDVHFCGLVHHTQKYKIYADMRVQCGHINKVTQYR